MPVATEPVNEILRTAGCSETHAPSWSPPEIVLRTPAGTTSRRISPSLSVESGVNGDGFTTIVLPARSAGAIFQMPSRSGKFHGVIAPTMPYGLRRTSTRTSGPSETTSTGIFSPAVTWNHTTPPITSSIAFASGFPCSWVSTCAISPTRALSASPQSRSVWRRFASSFRQLRSARCAASITPSSCAFEQSGACAKTSPVAGLTTPNVLSPATALPSIVMLNSDMAAPFSFWRAVEARGGQGYHSGP